MLDLPGITLVAVYNICHELTLAAVDECLRRARFGDVKLFTDVPLGRDVIPIKQGFDAFAWATHYEVPKHIKTSHILSVQWDSWIVNPEAWRSEFLDYDYIGAPWWYQRYNVGNSGFTIRSKRLIDFIAANRDRFPIREPEDDVLCRTYRPLLESFGFRWPSTQVAARFAFERTVLCPLKEIFGFHGQFNWPYVLSDDEIEARLVNAPRYVMDSEHCRQMRVLMAERRGRTDG